MPKVFVKDDYFSSQNKKMSYLLGFLAADGNVSATGNRIQSTLSIVDYDFLCMIQKEIGGCEVYKYQTNNGYDCCGWYCFSAKIKKDLAEYGIIPNKTGKIKIPDKLQKEYLADFIRGYFDGDGSICKDANGMRLSITSANAEILNDINSFFESNNIKPSKLYNDHNNFCIKFRTQACIDIYNLLYENAELFLPRKKEKYLGLIKEKYDSTRLRNLPEWG